MEKSAGRSNCQSLYFSTSLWLLNVRNIHEIPLHAGISINALAATRIVSDIMGQSLPDDDALQYRATRVSQLMCLATGSIANKIARADSIPFIAYDGLRLTFENIDALLFVVVHVQLSRLVAGLHFDNVETNRG
jgi:hypothetical protein